MSKRDPNTNIFKIFHREQQVRTPPINAQQNTAATAAQSPSIQQSESVSSNLSTTLNQLTITNNTDNVTSVNGTRQPQSNNNHVNSVSNNNQHPTPVTNENGGISNSVMNNNGVLPVGSPNIPVAKVLSNNNGASPATPVTTNGETQSSRNTNGDGTKLLKLFFLTNI